MRSLHPTRRKVLSTAAYGSGLILFGRVGVAFGAEAIPEGINDNYDPADPPPNNPPVANDNEPTGDVEQAGVRVLYLSRLDIVNLIKTTSTEVVASLHKEAFEAQVHGVVDTIVARLASGAWGASVSSVVNARWQFSAINSTLRGAYGRVEHMPMRAVNRKVAKEVLRWLELRAAGTPSSVGNNLNYLNPYYSSKSSLDQWGWDVVAQAEKTGMIYGSGRAVHFHGTSKGIKKLRPSSFVIRLPKDRVNGLSSPDSADRRLPKEPEKLPKSNAPKRTPMRVEMPSSSDGWTIFRNLFPVVFR